ncbi:MAG: hypothetical protein OEY97_07725 [Nitrospirota bacterium]|nr:hypothetical protein [Nitrospirota bacterium]
MIHSDVTDVLGQPHEQGKLGRSLADWITSVVTAMTRHLLTIEASDYTNSWAQHASYQAVAAVKQAGWVRLEGAVQGGTAGTAIFTLPEGMRPTATIRDDGAQVEITAAGVVTPDAAAGNTLISLAGLTFRV